MKITLANVYFGPNFYCNQKSVHLLLDLQFLAEKPYNNSDWYFNQGLRELIPGLSAQMEHDARIQFNPQAQSKSSNNNTALSNTTEPLKEYGQAVSIGHQLLTATLSLLDYLQHPTTYAELQPATDNAQCHLLIDYWDAEVVVLSATLVADCMHYLCSDNTRQTSGAKQLKQQLLQLENQARQHAPSVTRFALCLAAKKAAIPVLQLDRPPYVQRCSEAVDPLYNVLQFGLGRHLKTIKNTLPDYANNARYALCRNHRDYKQFLFQQGFPITRQDQQSSNINNLRRAVRSAERIGYPVSMHLLTEQTDDNLLFDKLENAQQLENAYRLLPEQSRKVHVESSPDGIYYQLLMVFQQPAALITHLPLTITGDGVSTFAQLLAEQKFQSALRCSQSALNNLLAVQGISACDIAAKHQVITVSRLHGQLRVDNVAQTLQCLHRSLIDAAGEICRQLKLDICAIQFNSHDISKPLANSDTVFTRLQISPDLADYGSIHDPLPVNIAQQLLSGLFNKKQHSRIPIIAITGTNGKTTTCRMLQAIIRQTGKNCAATDTDGIYKNEDTLLSGFYSGVAGASVAMTLPDSDYLVLETSRGTQIEKGLGFEFSDVAVCTNVEYDHIGLNGVNSVAEMAEIKSIVINNARDTAILNADNAYCLSMREKTLARRCILVSGNPENPALMQHIAQGKPAIVTTGSIGQQQIVYHHEGVSEALLAVAQIPATHNGLATFNVENAMHAIACAIALNIPIADIRQALQNFTTSYSSNPGRLNQFHGLPFKVYIDYAHNPHGFSKISPFLDSIKTTGHRILVFMNPDDREESTFHDMAAIVANKFDYFLCRDIKEVRVLKPGEAPKLLKKHLISQAVPENHIETFKLRETAVQRALEIAKVGEDNLLFIAGGSYKQTWQELEVFRENFYK